VPRYRCCSQYLILVSEFLSDRPSIQEILWNFSRFKDEKMRLTLRENPHFYTRLPMLPEEYEDRVEVYPTKDFEYVIFHVLTDKPEPVHVMTDSQSFGNFWCPKNAIIFKGLGTLFLFSPLYLMYCQTSVGCSGGKPSSRSLSAEPHHVGSVSGSQCPPFQELP
jgi:hypothetical protein